MPLEEGAGNSRRIQEGVVRSFREKIRKEKVQLEFNLVNHWCEMYFKSIFIIHQQLKERQRKSPCFIEHGGGQCQRGQDKD